MISRNLLFTVIPYLYNIFRKETKNSLPSTASTSLLSIKKVQTSSLVFEVFYYVTHLSKFYLLLLFYTCPFVQPTLFTWLQSDDQFSLPDLVGAITLHRMVKWKVHELSEFSLPGQLLINHESHSLTMGAWAGLSTFLINFLICKMRIWVPTSTLIS